MENLVLTTVPVDWVGPKGERLRLTGWNGVYGQAEGVLEPIPAERLQPADERWLESCLDILQPTERYGPQTLLSDLEKLKQRHPDIVNLEIMGYSELGRPIPALRMGREAAPCHVLLQGAIHAREHMTAWLLTAMADHWLGSGMPGMSEICWHLIPMTNPDGVLISQSRRLEALQEPLYQREGSGQTRERYAARWKANALGVDLNRNFPSGWEYLKGAAEPSSERYRGRTPFCAAETKALRDYTHRYPFAVTISYHATGSVIYYEYGSRREVNDRSHSLGKAVEQVTGYPLEGCASLEGGGYKDWVMDGLGIPSLTIEIGCQEAPLAFGEIHSIFARNINVLPAIARWLQKEKRGEENVH